MQPLCNRVAIHTDGKETSAAWEQWWDLLGLADPQSLTQIVASRVLSECNDPNWPFSEAPEKLWRLWSEDSDPLLAGLLRLTLDTPLDPLDAPRVFSPSWEFGIRRGTRILICSRGSLPEPTNA